RAARAWLPSRSGSEDPSLTGASGGRFQSRLRGAPAESLPVIASIPSPHTGTIELGPLVIHMYGLMLLVAIAACVTLTGYRYVSRGGDWDLVLRVAVWGVAAGIVGARLYHDLTSWN